MPAASYQCAMCGVICVNPDDWTEEDRLAEMRSHFGDVPKEEQTSVCDLCWNKIRPDRN